MLLHGLLCWEVKLLEEEAGELPLKTRQEDCSLSSLKSDRKRIYDLLTRWRNQTIQEKVSEAVEIKCLDSWKVVKALWKTPATWLWSPDYSVLLSKWVNLQKLYFCIYSDVFTNPDLLPDIWIKAEDYREKIELTGRAQNATLIRLKEKSKINVLRKG